MLAPDHWLALIRVVVGLWFFKSVFSKLQLTLAGGVFPLPVATPRWIGFMPRRIEEWAAVHPSDAYASFLRDTVNANAELFASLTAFGEVAVGLGLTLGLLTGWSAIGGLFLIVNYYLASFGLPFNQQGFHILLIACLLALLFARAGRRWGLDGVLLRRSPAYRRVPLV